MNLNEEDYRRAREVFPHVKYSNFDPIALSTLVAQSYSLKVKKIKFYTGIPPKKRNPRWNKFWSKKLALLGKSELVETFTRKTQLREKIIVIEGKEHKIKVDAKNIYLDVSSF